MKRFFDSLAGDSRRGHGWRASLLAAAMVFGGAALGFMALGGGTAAGQATSPTGRATHVSPENRAASAAQFDKAKALYVDQHYAEANVENDKALQLDPGNGDAVLLKRVLQSKLAGSGESTEGPGGPRGSAAAAKYKLLTPQQVSIIRLMEMSGDDRSVLGRVDRKVLDDFWENEVKANKDADVSARAHDQFVAVTNFPAQALRIRDSGRMKYIERVTIRNDPANMVAFRNIVHPYVLQSCAVSECHGGENGGAFRLIPEGAAVGAADQTLMMYTNFYIMATYQQKNGPGRMIDRDNPEKSLFLQYGLPKTAAELLHPGKEQKRLGSVNDLRFVRMRDWVKSLAFPAPVYGITYEVPGASGTQPATAPATKPAGGRGAASRSR